MLSGWSHRKRFSLSRPSGNPIIVNWATVATDNFDRGNGVIGSNWSTAVNPQVNAGSHVISSIIAAPSGATWTFSGNYYSAASPRNNQRVTATTTVGYAGAVWVGLYVRYSQGPNGATGYFTQMELGGSNNIIYRYENGVNTATVVSAPTLSVIPIGTPIRFSAEGSALRVETYSGGVWSTRFGGIDAAIPSGGTGGIYSQAYSTNGWNDFILEDGDNNLSVTNYQMKALIGESPGVVGASVDCGGVCKSDFSDLRFTNSDGTTLLNYWIESVSGTTPNQLATVWIKFDYIAAWATIFYMYYGNASATAVSSGVNTFILFEDFNALNTADLNGQNGWSGHTNWDVGTTTKYEGAKAATSATGGTTVQVSKAISSPSNYHVFMQARVRHSQVSTANGLDIYLREGNTTKAAIAISSGQFKNIVPSVWNDIGKVAVNDTWYKVVVALDSIFTHALWVDDVKYTPANVTNITAVSSTVDAILLEQYVAGGSAFVDQIVMGQYSPVGPVWGAWEVEYMGGLELYSVAKAYIEGAYGQTYYKTITITGSAGAGTDYQVYLRVGESSGSSSYDFYVNSLSFPISGGHGGDLRFASADGSITYAFYVVDVTGTTPNRTANVYVKVGADLSSNQNIRCYYGWANPLNLSNGDNTFIFFDEFTGTSINASKWGYSAAGVSVANSLVVINRTTTNTNIWTLNALATTSPFIVDVKYQRPSKYRNRLYLGVTVGGGPATGYDYGDFDSSIYWNGWSGVQLTNDTWYIMQWINSSTNYTWRILQTNGTSVISRSYGSAIPTAKYLNFGGSESDLSDCKIDYVFVRKYVATSPSFGSAGSEIQIQVTILSTILAHITGMGTTHEEMRTFTYGYDTVVANVSAYLDAGLLSYVKNEAFVHGWATDTISINAYVDTSTSIYTDLASHVYGAEVASTDVRANVVGLDYADSTIKGYMSPYISFPSKIRAHVCGYITVNTRSGAYTFGVYTTQSVIHAYMHASRAFKTYIHAHTFGYETTHAQLYTSLTGSLPLHVDVSAHTFGVEQLHKGMPASIRGWDFIYSAANGFVDTCLPISGFAKARAYGFAYISANRNMFVKICDWIIESVHVGVTGMDVRDVHVQANMHGYDIAKTTKVRAYIDTSIRVQEGIQGWIQFPYAKSVHTIGACITGGNVVYKYCPTFLWGWDVRSIYAGGYIDGDTGISTFNDCYMWAWQPEHKISANCALVAVEAISSTGVTGFSHFSDVVLADSTYKRVATLAYEYYTDVVPAEYDLYICNGKGARVQNIKITVPEAYSGWIMVQCNNEWATVTSDFNNTFVSNGILDVDAARQVRVRISIPIALTEVTTLPLIISYENV